VKASGEAKRDQATFMFDPDEIKAADEPSRDGPRLVWMIVSLLRDREFAFDRYAAMFVVGDRTFKRDVKKLRELGEAYGFTLTSHKGGRVVLEHFDADRAGRAGTAHRLSAAPESAVAETLQAVVDALGDVIGRQLAGHVDLTGASIDRFLRIATPRLRAQTAVADVYAALREAWTDRARVRFRYPSRDGRASHDRVVEPYLTTYVAGRYYLVGFDVRPRSGGWRQFALDRIIGPIRRAGSFARRTVPAAYRGEDAIGLFKTRPAIDVTIALSATIAEAVIGREWQRAQRAVREPDGTATLTLAVYDLAEAVRWTLGFGAEARIVAPPEAVVLARNLALEVAALYAPSDVESRLA
jgi:predicted DNA-binding transcriptional regulator YafY